MWAMGDLRRDQRTTADDGKNLNWQKPGCRDLENCSAKQDTDHQDMHGAQNDIQVACPGRMRSWPLGNRPIMISHLQQYR